MSVDVRQVHDLDEFTRAVFAIGQYFGMTPTEERMQRFLDQITAERMYGAWTDGAVVGGTGSFAFNLSVPGGDVPTAGISVVGVYPTHRRRGVLRALMRAQLEGVRERGEPLAALWASEETIYGRFGYGQAAWAGEINLAHEYTAFAQPQEPQGTLRFIEPEDGLELLPPVFEQARLQWPGMFSRSKLWWEHRELKDPEERRDGAGPKRWVVYERDGALEGYAVYRHKPGWEQGSTTAELRVVEAIGTTPTALRDIWAYLLAIDWKARVTAFLLPPDHPLFYLLATPRRLRYRMGDGIWVRLVDVGAALSGRTYTADDSIVLDLHDEFCPWNTGRWKVADGEAVRSDGEPDIALSARSLGSVYLGGISFASLARAGLVEELQKGALSRGDAMFRSDRHPWCPEIF